MKLERREDKQAVYASDDRLYKNLRGDVPTVRSARCSSSQLFRTRFLGCSFITCGLRICTQHININYVNQIVYGLL